MAPASSRRVPEERPRDVAGLLGSRRTQSLPPPPALPVAAPEPKDEAAATDVPVADSTESQPAADPRQSRPPRSAPSGGQRGRATAGRAQSPSRAGRSSPRSRTRSAAAANEDQTRPIAAYLPADLRRQVGIAAKQEDSTLGEWLLDAYEAVFDRLDEVYGGPQDSGATRRSGLPQRRRRRREVEVGVQVQFSLTGAELAVLEEHMSRLGVGSRSEFLTTIAELGLGHRR